MTKKHIDRLSSVGKGSGITQEHGTYSIGIVREVPSDSANLAFVSGGKLSVNKNISLQDYCNTIVENQPADYTADFHILTQDGSERLRLRIDAGAYTFHTSDLLITDEFSVPNTPLDTIYPLYYKAVPSYSLYTTDLAHSGLMRQYAAGYNRDKSAFSPVVDDTKPMVYFGQDLIIRHRNGSALSDTEAYKVVLTKSASNIYNVVIYTNFQNTDNREYIVRYRRGPTAWFEESLNAATFFTRVETFDAISETQENYLAGNEANIYTYYIDQESPGKYNVCAPSKFVTINNAARVPARFRYRIVGTARDSYNNYNKCTLKIGIIYAAASGNDNTPCHVLASMNAKAPYGLPSFVTLTNPYAHPEYSPSQAEYWLIDINTPLEILENYDVILMTGYGAVDLDIYADKFNSYITDGGKLWIDNPASGEGTFIPSLIVNSSDIIGAHFTTNEPTAYEISVPTSTYLSNYYAVNGTDIAYVDQGAIVKAPIETATTWITLVSDSNNDNVVIYRQCGNGAIMMSSCGLFREYARAGGSNNNAKLVTNLLLTLAENKYISTPWIYDNVHHISSLFDNEYAIGGRTVYQKDVVNGVAVAKKILAPSTLHAILPYIEYNLSNATLNLVPQFQQLRNNVWTDATQIEYAGTNDGSEPLWVYCKAPLSAFTPLTVGYKESDVRVCDDTVPWQVTIVAYASVWGVNQNGQPVCSKVYGTSKKVIPFTVKYSDGYKDIATLINVLPDLYYDNSNVLWRDKTKVSYEIRIDTIAGVPNSKVNIGLYDKRLSKFYYAKDNTITIPYTSVFEQRSNPAAIGGAEMTLRAWTNEYSIIANDRTFGVCPDTNSTRVYLELPNNTDEREQWHVRIRNGRFVRSSIDKNNYLQYSTIVSSIYNGTYSVIDEVPLETGDILEYSVEPQYLKQAFWRSDGIKRVIHEKAQYVRDNTIMVMNSPLIITDLSVTEELVSLGDGITFKGTYDLWDEDVVPVLKDENNDTISMDEYDIDLSRGLVIFKEVAPYAKVIATYTCENTKVTRNRFANRSVSQEELRRISSSVYRFSHGDIATSPRPTLYHITPGSRTLIPAGSYTIDYERGLLRMHGVQAESMRIFADYIYYSEDTLTIADYNAEAGTINVAEPIDFTDIIYVSYEYQEKFLVYNGYVDAGQYFHLDLNPSEGHLSTQLITDTADHPVYSLEPTKNLINKSIYIYMLPSTIYDATTGAVKYQEEYPIRHCIGQSTIEYILTTYPYAVVLGEIIIRDQNKEAQALVLDTRKRGGGLLESITVEQIDRVYPGARYHWDIAEFDGLPYQGNGAFVIRIPKTVLTSYGGRFTEDEVQDIISKYQAYGTYAIIEYI